MRTSKISQDTTRIFNAISSSAASRRSTRSAKSLASFALGHDGVVEIKDEARSDGEDSAATGLSHDIEDVSSVASSTRRPRKRKYGADSATTTIVSTNIELTTTWASPRDGKVEKESDKQSVTSSISPPSRSKAKPKIPARKSTAPDGAVTIHPPSNWEEVYQIIKQMRRRNPTAPVDTMGCEDLFWENSSARDRRYQTLTALMLSSQTKDTVTAVAMQRLHTELARPIPDARTGKIEKSDLTIENILGCDPKWLDELIGKVGFHNNKTKYIKATAVLLRDEYNSDIPDTVEGLMRLPGVGPKMAYLCMSAAWGKDVGIGVDVHVHRITNLWGWHVTKSPEETRFWLEQWLPRDRWHEINKMLVGLGQTICLPIGRRCNQCDLAGTGLCKSEIRGLKVKREQIKVEQLKTENGGTASEDMLVEEKVRIKEELGAS